MEKQSNYIEPFKEKHFIGQKQWQDMACIISFKASGVRFTLSVSKICPGTG